MTGREQLNKELIKLGANKQQLTSKVIDMVLMVIANKEEAQFIYSEYMDKLEKAEQEKLNAENKKICAENELRCYRDEVIKLKDQARAEKDKYEYLNEKIMMFETPEARDKIRMATIYARAVKIDTVYDNTAYIEGLGKILSSQPDEEVIESKQITKQELKDLLSHNDEGTKTKKAGRRR